MAFVIQEKGSESSPSTLTVSEVTTRHLRRLKDSASDYLGKTVNAAVISVPTDFGHVQREALMKAAANAGLDVLQTIHEPIAAVLAYDARQDVSHTDKIVVVADLGGTRSDATVIASRGGIYTILATMHEYSLGGAQLDQVLIDFFANEFIKRNAKIDPRENARSLAKLKLEVETTKKALSRGSSASLGIESLAEGIDFSSTINRTRYEMLSSRIFREFIELITRVVQKAGLDVIDIDEVCVYSLLLGSLGTILIFST